MPQLVDNRYRIVRSLGSGGMADVHLAHDDVLDRDVALKILNNSYSDDEEFVERFRREAQSAAALSHPNIVSIYDRGETDDEPGTYYIAMEYLPGGSLKDRLLSQGALPARTAAEVALQIAEALKAAHERDVVHRDIKPHNILVTEAGDLKVTDFGIARAATSSTMTRTGSIMGTAHYISPEQAMGEPAGPQSDLYSLGVVLYEMLTGELPFDAETPIGIAMKHVNESPTPPGTLDSSLPEGLDAIALRLMSKDPEDRYPDESELIRDLEHVIHGDSPSQATTMVLAGAAGYGAGDYSTAGRTLAPPNREAAAGARRRRRLVPLLVLGVLALLALAGWGAYAMISQPPPTTQVPELEGLSLQEARDRVGEDFSVLVSERRDSQEPEGTILEQSPSAGTEREQGSEVSVAVSGQRVAEVPDVVGLSQNEAESRLAENDFEADVRTAESSADEEGEVISQSPSAGEEANYGSEITITVGEGPAPVEIPNLSGMTVSEAESALTDSDLELGEQSESASSEVSEGSILDQSPAAGSEAEPGSAVDVTVSTGPEPVSVPNLYGYNRADAEAMLANAGLSLGQVSQEPTSELGEGLIFSQSRAGGATVEPGSAIDVTISTGPAPVSVPDVVGDDLESAQQTLLDAGLGYTTQPTQNSEPAGTVLSTSPGAGTEAEPGTQVAISYSLGPPEPQQNPAPAQAPEPTPTSDPAPTPEQNADSTPTPEPTPAPEPEQSSNNSNEQSTDPSPEPNEGSGSGGEESGGVVRDRDTGSSESESSAGESGSGDSEESGVQPPNIEEPDTPEAPDIDIPDF